MSEYQTLEYQTCHQKVASAVQELIRIELYVVLALAVFYAWFYEATGTKPEAFERMQIILYLPILIVFLAGLRSFMQIKYLEALATHLRYVELRLAVEDSTRISSDRVGWENWYEPNPTRKWNSYFRRIFWASLLGFTIAVPYLEIGVPMMREDQSTNKNAP